MAIACLNTFGRVVGARYLVLKAQLLKVRLIIRTRLRLRIKLVSVRSEVWPQTAAAGPPGRASSITWAWVAHPVLSRVWSSRQLLVVLSLMVIGMLFTTPMLRKPPGQSGEGTNILLFRFIKGRTVKHRLELELGATRTPCLGLIAKLPRRPSPPVSVVPSVGLLTGVAQRGVSLVCIVLS